MSANLAISVRADAQQYADLRRSMQSYPRLRHRRPWRGLPSLEPVMQVHQKLAQQLAHTRGQRRQPKRRTQRAIAVVKVRANRDYRSASSQRYGHVPQTVAAALSILLGQVSPRPGERGDDEVFVLEAQCFQIRAPGYVVAAAQASA